MEWEQFCHDLEALGYFRYLTEIQKRQIPRMLRKLQKTHYFFSVKAKRDFYANPRSLMRRQVERFTGKDVRSFLRANHVMIHKISQNMTREGYTTTINGEDYVLYSSEELHDPDVDRYTLTTKRAFSIINKFLKEAGSEERIFSTIDGDPEWAIFLTSDLRALLANAGYVQEGRELFLYENDFF